jgi:NADPH:quinone reductase-like Zn-dependent oxidoreductase
MRTTMSTQTMRVIHVHRYGGSEQLQLEEHPRPEPKRGEVLVRIHAAGVNPIDWKIRQGVMKDVMPVTFPYIPGIEIAGVVEEFGPGVTDWEIGQAVFAQVAEGGYAEYLAVPAAALALKPEALSFVEAAAVPVGATTAWRTLFENGSLTAGQRVLIQGAAGGVGLFAVQFAKWKGAQVIGTASTANLEFVRALGADMVVDYATTPVESVVHDVDLVLDGVGALTLSSSLAVLKPGGTLISIAGPPPQEQAQARGVRAMMSRGAASVPLQTFTQMIEEGQLTVTAGKTFPLRHAQQAHEYGQSEHGRGRIVLQIVDEAASGAQE